MEEKKKYCVYRHKSFDDRVYIGITCQNVNRRWRKGMGYMHNAYFRRFLDKYGWDSMEHKVLYSGLTLQEAEEKEIKLIKFYQSDNPSKGFNIQKGGNSYGAHTEESKIKMSIARRNCNDKNLRPVMCVETRVVYKGTREAERQTSTSSSGISSNCNGKTDYAGKSINGTPLHWVYMDELYRIPDIINNVRFNKENLDIKERDMLHKYQEKCINRSKFKPKTWERKMVYQYDLQGQLIKTYFGVVMAAKETGCNKTAIAQRCNGNGLTCGGYLWSYELRTFTDKELLDAQISANRQTILQYNSNMELIAEYPEGKGLIDNPAYRFQSIRNVCNRFDDFAYGYVWRYKGETQEQFEFDKKYYADKEPSHKMSKIIQCTTDNQIVQIYDSLVQTAQNGFDRNRISLCCRGKRDTYKGYIWKYAD